MRGPQLRGEQDSGSLRIPRIALIACQAKARPCQVMSFGNDISARTGWQYDTFSTPSGKEIQTFDKQKWEKKLLFDAIADNFLSMSCSKTICPSKGVCAIAIYAGTLLEL